jgi:hypothetical protein
VTILDGFRIRKPDMAREESDREDLMREAVALNRRMEIGVVGFVDPIVLGFRDSTGWFSIYFGQDPVYTWDAAGQLRRAYEGGCLFRTQGTTLARLERVRSENAVELIRHDLDAGECESFLQRLRARLAELRDVLTAYRYTLQGCVTTPARTTSLKSGRIPLTGEAPAKRTEPTALHESGSAAEASPDESAGLVRDALAAIGRILEQPKPFAPPLPGKR